MFFKFKCLCKNGLFCALENPHNTTHYANRKETNCQLKVIPKMLKVPKNWLVKGNQLHPISMNH